MSSDESVVEEMRRYVRFDETDGRAVGGLAELATPHCARITASFYDRIREHEAAHAVFRDEAQVQRLHRSMEKWLVGLFGGDYGPEHFRGTAQIGKVHVRVGLPERYMHTAMALIRAELVQVTSEAATPQAVASLHKLLDLELAVMVDAYCEDFAARLRRAGATKEVAQPDYVRVIDDARWIVVGIDHAQHVRSFSREAERVTGWARDEVLGKPAIALLFGEEQVRAVERRLATVAQGDDVFFDGNLETRNGHIRQVRWQLLRTGPRQAEEGARTDLFLLGQDVTDEVTSADRARRAERLAAVGTLATGLAHEIRNPLNGAHLHLTFLDRALRRTGAEQEALDALATASGQIQRLGSLVTDFLQFARPQRVALDAIALEDVAQRAVAALSPEASRRGRALDLALPPSPVMIRGDVPRLEQVLLNVIRNGIEASESGAGRGVVVRVFRTPTQGVVEIEDDGPGIPGPDAPIFDAFFTTKPSGTGLGLSIAHRIAEDHGGQLTVESVPGRTVFRLALPRTSEDSGSGTSAGGSA